MLGFSFVGLFFNFSMSVISGGVCRVCLVSSLLFAELWVGDSNVILNDVI